MPVYLSTFSSTENRETQEPTKLSPSIGLGGCIYAYVQQPYKTVIIFMYQQIQRIHLAWANLPHLLGIRSSKIESRRKRRRSRRSRRKRGDFGEREDMVAVVSRTGRQLQRYNKGRRLVVGCIPYRYKAACNGSLKEERELEVLVISTRRQGKGMLFPKGGWETDESIKDAALRETLEEAGVLGNVQRKLGKWTFKSKSHDTDYEGYMFPLLVKKQLDLWPEKEFRQRVWMSVPEAREACQQGWMKEALDILECRLTPLHSRKSGKRPIK